MNRDASDVPVEDRGGHAFRAAARVETLRPTTWRSYHDGRPQKITAFSYLSRARLRPAYIKNETKRALANG
jgi:hypothetical protein